MIVNEPGTPTRTLGPADATTPTWRCLARRGMLHSECETFDHVALPPGRAGRHDDPGVEQAVHVLRGTATLRLGEETRQLDTDDVVLVPAMTRALVEAGPDGVELLVLRVLSKASRAALPPRVPELPLRERAIGDRAVRPHQEHAA